MSLIMPVFAVIIILFGLVRRVPVFDAFLTGAREGAQTLWRIAPTILGLIFAVGLLKSSGAVAVIDRVLAPAANAVGFPPEVVPMALLRPVSGSGSSALLMTVLQDCGPDSFAGRVASVLAGSSETIWQHRRQKAPSHAACRRRRRCDRHARQRGNGASVFRIAKL